MKTNSRLSPYRVQCTIYRSIEKGRESYQLFFDHLQDFLKDFRHQKYPVKLKQYLLEILKFYKNFVLIKIQIDCNEHATSFFTEIKYIFKS